MILKLCFSILILHSYIQQEYMQKKINRISELSSVKLKRYFYETKTKSIGTLHCLYSKIMWLFYSGLLILHCNNIQTQRLKLPNYLFLVTCYNKVFYIRTCCLTPIPDTRFLLSIPLLSKYKPGAACLWKCLDLWIKNKNKQSQTKQNKQKTQTKQQPQTKMTNQKPQPQ